MMIAQKRLTMLGAHLQSAPIPSTLASQQTSSSLDAKAEVATANALAPSSFRHELRATAKALVAPGKGILACDEPPHVLPTRMKMCWKRASDCTEEWRRGYRELLFSAPELSRYVSGVILHDETVFQKIAGKSGKQLPCCQALNDHGIIAGIKVDKAFHPMLGANGETHTQGLDGLGDRCKTYYEQGCRFAKWRAPIHVGNGRPSERAIQIECHGLARYASICQQHGLMPIVEPDVVMDGDHSLEVSALVTKRVLSATFAALDMHGVDLEGILIKTNMVRPGKDHRGGGHDPSCVAAATLQVFGSSIPPLVPGIVFLSGGMSENFATSALQAINAHPKRKRLPWALSYSFGRALQHSARVTWKGSRANYRKAQAALRERARMNSEASLGMLQGQVQGSGDAASASLHVSGGNRY